MTSSYEIKSQEDLLMENTLMPFYQHNIAEFLEVVGENSHISLRVIDWFVTNYSKQFGTFYEIQRPGQRPRTFFVHNEYKNQLTGHGKKHFDPFRRRGRITFQYCLSDTGEESSIETTVAQLNFFKWAIENLVIEYIKTHLKEIIDDMNVRNVRPKDDEASTTSTASDGSLKHRKRELSVAATRKISQHRISMVVQFGKDGNSVNNK